MINLLWKKVPFGEINEVWLSKNNNKFRLVDQTKKAKFSMKLTRSTKILKLKVRAKNKCGNGKFSTPIVYQLSSSSKKKSGKPPQVVDDLIMEGRDCKLLMKWTAPKGPVKHYKI
jgi:hypothetical protein